MIIRLTLMSLFLLITRDIKTQINAQPDQSTSKKDTIKTIAADTTRETSMKKDAASSAKTNSLKTKKTNKRMKKQTNDSLYVVPAYVPYNGNRDVKKYPSSDGGASEILRDIINRNRRQ
jgi:hypothetical protein